MGAGGVEPRQLFAKPDAAQTPIKLESFLSDRLGDFGNRRQTVLECTEIESGAADENRQPSRFRCYRDLVERQRTPVSDRAAFGGIEKAIEPMRCSLFGRGIGARRQDSEIAIDLLAVGIYDGSAQGTRQLERKY